MDDPAFGQGFHQPFSEWLRSAGLFEGDFRGAEPVAVGGEEFLPGDDARPVGELSAVLEMGWNGEQGAFGDKGGKTVVTENFRSGHEIGRAGRLTGVLVIDNLEIPHGIGLLAGAEAFGQFRRGRGIAHLAGEGRQSCKRGK